MPDDRSYHFSAQGVRVHPAAVLWASGGVVTAVAVGLVVALVFGALDAGKSAETQDHGVSRTATVLSMTINAPTGRGAGPATETFDVRLDSPFDGRSATTVHVPGDSAWYVNDATVQILIDPQDPGYAELPGQPLTTSDEPWDIVIALLAVLIVQGLMILRARKRLRAMAALRGDGKRGPAGHATRA